MATSREIVLKAIQKEDDDDEDLSKIIIGQLSKDVESINMAEAFVALTNTEQSKLCKRWKRIADQNLTKLSTEETDENVVVTDSKVQVEIIMGTATALIAILRDDTFLSSKDMILPIIQVLHDGLVRLPFKVDKLKNRICQICERWWSRDLSSKLSVFKNVVLYLLQRSVSSKNPMKGDIKRVYFMRDAIKNVNEDEEIYELLLKCVVSSFYIQINEGRKFIAFAFNLNANHIHEFHLYVKIKLVDCTSAESFHYGDIYLRAWFLSVDHDEIHGILEDCIQDIIQHAVNASSQKLFTSLFKFLSSIHNHKTETRVGKMLVRLYEPIIWRSLKVANGTVRANATSIFFSLFPLEDSSAKTVEANENIQHQMNTIKDILFDPYPLVRTRSIMGTCKICSEYWELIPESVTQNLMLNLVEKLAFDAASVQVRNSVFKGLSLMIENPVTHSFLKVILPKIGKCLHDVNESVRIVFIEMLLKFRGLKKLKFWDVISAEELLARLAADTQAVGRRIVSLLLNSYHPLTKGNEVLLERSIFLINTNRAASRCFYLHAHQFISLEDIVNFMLVVCKFLHKYTNIEIKKSIALGEMDDIYQDPYEDDDDEGNGNTRLDVEIIDDFNLSPDVICGLIDAVSILWARIRPELATVQGATYRKKLVLRYTSVVPKFYKVFKNSEVAPSMMFLSSFLPPSAVSMSVSYCASQLRSLKMDCPPEVYENILGYMCNWGRADDVLEIISDWLNAGLNTELNTPARTRLRTSGNSVRFQEVREPCPQLAVDFLTYMLKQVSCRNALLNGQRFTLVEITNKLRKIQKCINEQLITGADCSAETNKFSATTFDLMCKLGLLLHDEENDTPFNGVQFLSITLRFVEDHVIPQLLIRDSDGLSINSMNRSSARLRTAQKRRSGTSNKVLALQVLQIFLGTCHNTLLVGVVDIRFAAQISNFINALATRVPACVSDEDVICDLIQEICFVIHRLHEYSLVSGADARIILNTTVPKLIVTLFKSMQVCLEKFSNAKSKLTTLCRPTLLDILKNYWDYTSKGCEGLQNMMITMTKTVIGELSCKFRDIKGDEEIDEIDELLDIQSLPALSYIIVSIAVSRNLISRLFLQEMVAFLKSKTVCDLPGLLTASNILHIFFKHKVPISDLKDSLFVLENKTGEIEREGVVLPDAGPFNNRVQTQILVTSLVNLKRLMKISL